MAIGVKQGDIVALMLPNVPENIYCMYALNKIGAISNMIDLRSKGNTLVHYLEEAGAEVAVICNLFAENIFKVLKKTSIKKLIVASPFDSLPKVVRCIAKMRQAKLVFPLNAIKWGHFFRNGETENVKKGTSEVVCILHTSGTTDMSKGVMLTNKSFNAMTIQYKYCGLEFASCDRFLNQVPPFLAYNVIMATHLPLTLHMSVILLPDYQPDKFAENIINLRPNHAIAGPADWNNFLDYSKDKRKKYNLSFLKTMASGSDMMFTENKQAVNVLVHEHGAASSVMEGYGMTEIGSAACTNLPQCDVIGSVGIPLPKNVFCIYDNDLEMELPYGKIGEICMRGPTVMQGYYKNTEETEKVLRRHKDGRIWLHSGDLGYISQNGNVFLEGRIKRMILRYDGIKISPFSLEKTIMKHANVVVCCVVGTFDTVHQRGQVPVAYIVLHEKAESTIEEVRKLCEQEHSADYLPHGYEILEALPLTPNGKVDYKALEKLR